LQKRRDKKKNMIFLLVWDNDCYTGSFLTTFFLFVHRLMGTWTDSTVCLLWFALQQTLVCRYCYCVLTYITLGIYPAVVKQDCMVVPFLVFWGIFILISIVAEKFYIPTNSVQGFLFQASLPAFIVITFFLSVVQFQLRALCLLGRRASTWAMPLSFLL
jgi:hypothetical protein